MSKMHSGKLRYFFHFEKWKCNTFCTVGYYDFKHKNAQWKIKISLFVYQCISTKFRLQSSTPLCSCDENNISLIVVIVQEKWKNLFCFSGRKMMLKAQ